MFSEDEKRKETRKKESLGFNKKKENFIGSFVPAINSPTRVQLFDRNVKEAKMATLKSLTLSDLSQ